MFRAMLFVLVLVILYPVSAREQTIHINLVPRDYVEPCEQEGFICGVDKTVDPERLIGEQNSDYVFEFLDKTSDPSPEYRTSVFDVSAPNTAGQPTRFIQESPDGKSGLVCLFLAPPKSQCNILTIEDAAKEKEGYYPVFIGRCRYFTLVMKSG